MKRIFRLSIAPVVFGSLVPAVASAQTISSILGLFNIGAGLILVAGILVFFGGFIGYLVLLGTEKRKEGLFVMVWGIAILFVLSILLGAIDMLQGSLSFIIGMGVVVFLIIVAIIGIGKATDAKPKAEHKE